MSETVAVAPGTYVVRNTDPHMAGQIVNRNNKRVRLDKQGVGVFPDDCGIHLCGSEWQIMAGEPRVVIVNARPGSDGEVRPAPGPLRIWKGPEGEVEGQRVQGRDGSILFFNNSGYAAAPDNCGLHVVPGYRMLEEATAETMARYGVAPPRTLADLQDEENERLLSAIGDEEEDEEDPYRSFLMDLAGKQLASVAHPNGELEGEGAPAEPEKSADEARQQMTGMTRSQLEVIAKSLQVEAPGSNTKYPNKQALVDAIMAAAEAAEDEQDPDAEDGAGAAQGAAGMASGVTAAPVAAEAEARALEAARKAAGTDA